jgi:hypothetical protein
VVKLAKDERHEDVAGGDGGLGIGVLDGFEAGEGSLVVEVVEVVVGLADLGSEVDGIGVGRRIVVVGEGRDRQQEGEKKAEDFEAAFYDSSPKTGRFVVPASTSF